MEVGDDMDVELLSRLIDFLGDTGRTGSGDRPLAAFMSCPRFVFPLSKGPGFSLFFGL